MRIGFLQLFLSFVLSSYAYDHVAKAQGILDRVVSVSIEKGQLKDVFNLLKNQTGARFVYSSKTIEGGRKVSIKASQKKLSEVLEELLTPPEIVILRGERNEVRDAQKELAKIYAPHRLVLSVPSDAKDLPAPIAEKKPGTGLIAYVCTGSVCSAPISGLSALAVHLRLK